MKSKNRLLVLAGKPGVGKSSIIKKIGAGWTVIDVWHFLVPLIESGEVPPEEKNIIAYTSLYEYLTALDTPRVILELGTNYPELNASSLVELSTRYEIDILLCHTSIDICRERLQGRGYRTQGEGIERRLQRDFPNTFLEHLRDTGLRHHLIDTSRAIESVCDDLRIRFLGDCQN
jgi:broad-specificity NMP kinase